MVGGSTTNQTLHHPIGSQGCGACPSPSEACCTEAKQRQIFHQRSINKWLQEQQCWISSINFYGFKNNNAGFLYHVQPRNMVV